MPLLSFGWRYVADGLQKASAVEPVDPFQSGELHGFEVSPRSSPMDDLGLVKTVDRFSESVVIAVANTPDRRLDARFRQPFGIANGHILRAAVGMVNEPASGRAADQKRLVECIENETRMGCPACPPTDDAASEGIDHERDVDEALPSGHIREIRKPEHVRRGCVEVPVHPVERARRGLVRHGGFDGFATDNALQPHCPHKPSNRAAGDVVAFSLQLPRDFAHAIDLEVLIEHPAYLDLQADIATGSDRQAVHIPDAWRRSRSRLTGQSAKACRSARPRTRHDVHR